MTRRLERCAVLNLTLIAFFALSAAPAAARQDEGPPASQHGTVSQTINRTVITIEYDRPVARGRQLFGDDGIVVDDALWTPGANRATNIAFSTDVTVAGKPVPAGRYSLWTIPRDGAWTVILNQTWDTHHAIYPGDVDDVLRMEIATTPGSHMETLVLYFPVVGPYSATLNVHWGETVLPIEIGVPR